jgi:hypothetical protein
MQRKPTFHPLGDFLNPALALLGQGLKKSPIGQKLDFDNHPYLCKGLYWYFFLNFSKIFFRFLNHILLGIKVGFKISSNLVLAELRLGLKNRQVGEKWISDDCFYLCKGLR